MFDYYICYVIKPLKIQQSWKKILGIFFFTSTKNSGDKPSYFYLDYYCKPAEVEMKKLYEDDSYRSAVFSLAKRMTNRAYKMHTTKLLKKYNVYNEVSTAWVEEKHLSNKEYFKYNIF